MTRVLKSPSLQERDGTQPSTEAGMPTWELRTLVKQLSERLDHPEWDKFGLSKQLVEVTIERAQAELLSRGYSEDTEQNANSSNSITLPSIPLSQDTSIADADRNIPPKPMAIPKELGRVQLLSNMDPKAVVTEVRLGTISPPISASIGFITGGPRIPTPSGTLHAISLDPEVVKTYKESRNQTYQTLEPSEDCGAEAPTSASEPSQSVSIELEMPIDPEYLPVPTGAAVLEWAGDERLSLPQAGQVGVLVENGFEDAAYHIGKASEVCLVPFEQRVALAPSLEEMRYWQSALPIPDELRSLLNERLASTDPFMRDQVCDLIFSYISGKNEQGRSLFSYVCHPAVGQLLEEQGADLPFVLSELKIGHCDYLAWYTCGLLRGYAVPAWMTTEHFPTESGDAFNVSCGHARVKALSMATGAEVLFDPTTCAELGRGWLPEVLPHEVVNEWRIQLKAAQSYDDKRQVLQNILADVATRASSPDAERAGQKCGGMLSAGVLGALLSDDSFHLSEDSLGCTKVIRSSGSAWQALRAQGDVEAIRKIVQYFDKWESSASIPNGWSVDTLTLQHVFRPETASINKVLVAELLTRLHRIKRPLMSIGENYESSSFIFEGDRPQEHSWAGVTFFTSFTDPQFVRRVRDQLSPSLRFSHNIEQDIDVPAALVIGGHKRGKIEFILCSEGLRDLPLAVLSDSLVDQSLETLDLKLVGRALKKHRFVDWYVEKDHLGEGRTGAASSPKLLPGLVKFEIDLHKALFAPRSDRMTKLMEDYGLTRSDIRTALIAGTGIDPSTGRPIGPPSDYEDEAKIQAENALRAYAITPDCRRRMRGVFAETIHSLLQTEVPQVERRQEDLREYQPGDDTRYIDWKTSARTEGLRVRLSPAPSQSSHNTLTVLIDSTVSIRSLFQINEVIDACKGLARTGRTVLLGSTASPTYIKLTSKMQGMSNAQLLAAISREGSLAFRPLRDSTEVTGIAIDDSRGNSKAPESLVIVGDSFGRLLYLRELCKGVSNCRTLWLGAKEVDVYPLPRKGFVPGR